MGLGVFLCFHVWQFFINFVAKQFDSQRKSPDSCYHPDGSCCPDGRRCPDGGLGLDNDIRLQI